MDVLISFVVFILALIAVWVQESFAAFIKEETNLMDDKVTSHLVKVGLMFISLMILLFSLWTRESMVNLVLTLQFLNRILLIENYGLTIPIPQKYNLIYLVRKVAFNK